MLRVIAVEMLEDAGFQVFEAADGVEALELLKSQSGNLAAGFGHQDAAHGRLCPGRGGPGAASPDLKVLLMTGYAQEPPPALLKQAEVQILHKPFNLERLCALAAEMTQS